MVLDATLKSALADCQTTPENAFSLPPECYVNSAVADEELNTLFAKSWFGVGRSDVAAEPGDFITMDIAGQAFLLVRGRDAKLRVFANTCRHRSARLQDGQGNCRGLRCTFHSWTYRLDGTLVAAPHMDDVAGFERENFNLIEFRTAERGGFAFVCLNSDAPEIDVVLGDFPKTHTPWPLETLVTTRRREITVNCNWKAFLEVFNEYYHLPFVHADSIDDVYNEPDAPTVTAGAYVSQFGRTQGTGGLLQTEQDKALPPIPGLTGEAAEGVRYTWVFPNMTFAAGTDALWLYEAYPIGPNKCHVVQTACFPPETLASPDAETKLAAYHARLDAALAEDIPALENQHRGFSSPHAKQGRFQPLLEPNVAGFAKWYATQMTTQTAQQERKTP
jgi:phenylpropionate dioxygenase-like ring-hydroxylating dioxygenase large terminal subunit